MGLLFTESCDSYGVTADLGHNWTALGTWTWNSTAGRTGGGAIVSSSASSGSNLTGPAGLPAVSLGASGTLQGYAFWIKVSAKPASTLNLFVPCNQYWLTINTNGILCGNTPSAANVPGWINICDGNWHWVEWECNYTGGGGLVFTVWVDTMPQNMAISSNTGGVAITTFTFVSMVGCVITFDDFVIIDNNAPAPQASAMPFGPSTLTTKRPNADHAIQFAPNAGGTNYTQVNEVASDEDTTYVQDGTSTQNDLYGYAALGFTPTHVWGANLFTRWKDPGAGTINIHAQCTSGVTNSKLASTVIPVSYNNQRWALNQDPNTSAAWTGANLDAAYFGVGVT